MHYLTWWGPDQLSCVCWWWLLLAADQRDPQDAAPAAGVAPGTCCVSSSLYSLQSQTENNKHRYMLREFLSILFTITDWKQQTQVHVAWVPLYTLYNHRLKTTNTGTCCVNSSLYSLQSQTEKTKTGTCCASSNLQSLQSQNENNAGIWRRSSSLYFIAYNQLYSVLYNQLYFVLYNQLYFALYNHSRTKNRYMTQYFSLLLCTVWSVTLWKQQTQVHMM